MLLPDYARKHGLAVKGYCLMTNHVHVVAVPQTESTPGDVFKPVHLKAGHPEKGRVPK